MQRGTGTLAGRGTVFPTGPGQGQQRETGSHWLGTFQGHGLSFWHEALILGHVCQLPPVLV